MLYVVLFDPLVVAWCGGVVDVSDGVLYIGHVSFEAYFVWL